ncbi:Calcium-transporting ATPase 10, plasma membrane-type [Arachis hypogaea]|nr:Calcium-transporting ATPase 10, plasma membrane-type [Arachis hypogaea]
MLVGRRMILLVTSQSSLPSSTLCSLKGGNDVEVARSPTEKAILHWGLEADSEVHIHWKGAAEIVLACCTRYIDANDQLVDMDEEKMVSFRKAIEDMAAESLRCVAIAYRTFEKENVPATEEERAHWSLPEDNLVLLAIVGLKDPCRPGVKDSVELCQKSGVKVKMVTLMSKLQKQLLWRKNFSCHDRCRDEIAEAISVRRQQYFQALKRESIEEEGTCGCNWGWNK